MIGIIAAMNVEMDGLRAHMESPISETVSGVTFVRGIIEGREVVTAVCGIGKVFAALCAQTMILRYAPEAIINTGVAGSLDASLDIGDILVSTDAVHHDMDVTNLGYAYGEVPGMGVIAFPADPTLRAAAVKAVRTSDLGVNVVEGRVASGDQFVCRQDQKDRIAQTFQASCCEMEGASIAHACYLANVPFVVVRAISDKADGSSSVEYPTFERKAAHDCARIVRAMVSAL